MLRDNLVVQGISERCLEGQDVLGPRSWRTKESWILIWLRRSRCLGSKELEDQNILDIDVVEMV